MKLFFAGRGTTPMRGCELCLQPMRFLGEHAECQLFRCDDCALVSTDGIDPPQDRSDGAADSRYVV